jgi:hypothetical protein
VGRADDITLKEVPVKTDEEERKELEMEVERLQQEADRYRKATEDCLQQLGWCIGYFAGVHKPRIAHDLAINVGYVRRALLQRPEVVMPTSTE